MSRALALTETQVDQVDRFWRGFMSPNEIAKHTGLHVTTVKAALRHRPVEVSS